MNKFLAIVKREYLQRLRSKMLIMITILGPIMLGVFTILPGLLFSLKAGGATRVAILDQTEGMKLYRPIREALLTQKNDSELAKPSIAETMNSSPGERLKRAGKSMSGSFSAEPVSLDSRSLPEIKAELNRRIGRNEIDGYLLIPPDVLTNSESKVAYYGRNIGDLITRGQIADQVDRAVRRQRLIAKGVEPQEIENLSKQVELTTYPIDEKGEEGVKDSGSAGFALVFVIAFLIYLSVLLYGQMILGAVIEEKETRIAEVLFSSVRSFTLMFGKLIGVSLVALTQVGIWMSAFALISLYGLSALAASGAQEINLPHLPPVFYLYFFVFFHSPKWLTRLSAKTGESARQSSQSW